MGEIRGGLRLVLSHIRNGQRAAHLLAFWSASMSEGDAVGGVPLAYVQWAASNSPAPLVFLPLQVLASVAGSVPEGVYVETVLPKLQPFFAAAEWTPETVAVALATQLHYPVRALSLWCCFPRQLVSWRRLPSRLQVLVDMRHHCAIVRIENGRSSFLSMLTGLLLFSLARCRIWTTRRCTASGRGPPTFCTPRTSATSKASCSRRATSRIPLFTWPGSMCAARLWAAASSVRA